MEIVPLAADSLGTRSMATFVKTSDIAILIDPAVCLAPNKFGLPPHSIEIKAMNEQWREMCKYAERGENLSLNFFNLI